MQSTTTMQQVTPNDTTNYSFDARNRLVGASDTNGLQATYGYDAIGERISANVNGTQTNFSYSAGQVWADLNSGNSLVTRYLAGVGVDEKVAFVSSGGAVDWLETDRMGSTRNVVDSTGAVVGTMVFDGVGNTIAQTGTTTLYGYAGYRQWSELGHFLAGDRSIRVLGTATATWMTFVLNGNVVNQEDLRPGQYIYKNGVLTGPICTQPEPPEKPVPRVPPIPPIPPPNLAKPPSVMGPNKPTPDYSPFPQNLYPMFPQTLPELEHQNPGGPSGFQLSPRIWLYFDTDQHVPWGALPPDFTGRPNRFSNLPFGMQMYIEFQGGLIPYRGPVR